MAQKHTTMCEKHVLFIIQIVMNWYALIMISISALVSLLAVNWIYFKILKIAKEKNLVDNPDARKLQKNPVPVVGGLAVFFGLIMGTLAGIAIFGFFGSDTVNGNDMITVSRMLPIMLGMSIMLYVGCMDDILGLSPKARFLIEILVILGLIFSSGISIDSLHNMWTIGEIPTWIAIPLTIFAGVGIINAINMVDGVNGLSLFFIPSVSHFDVKFILVEFFIGQVFNLLVSCFTISNLFVPSLCHFSLPLFSFSWNLVLSLFPYIV
jgi:UDP-N-acetylmuramyl pentapeptide phosphotransferase/UDP-N-acetylglucosamine-1-phosphate transferase